MNYYMKIPFAFAIFFLIQPMESKALDQTQSEVLPKLERAIFNFHEVEPGFYRSGQLPVEAYPYLKKLGIKTVVNFIHQKKEAAEEKEGLASFGIDTIWIPWSGFDFPKDEDVEKFLSATRDTPKRPILVHCRRGAERTGLMVACWRIAEKGWSAEQAFQEMKVNRFRWFLYGHLKKYVYDFAKRYGQKAEYSNTIWEESRTKLFYAFYRLRKLNPFE